MLDERWFPFVFLGVMLLIYYPVTKAGEALGRHLGLRTRASKKDNNPEEVDR